MTKVTFHMLLPLKPSSRPYKGMKIWLGKQLTAVVYMQSACQERSAAVAALQALQTCEEKARCNLHVGMTQVIPVLPFIIPRVSVFIHYVNIRQQSTPS